MKSWPQIVLGWAFQLLATKTYELDYGEAIGTSPISLLPMCMGRLLIVPLLRLV
jgi:hypothetical protein